MKKLKNNIKKIPSYFNIEILRRFSDSQSSAVDIFFESVFLDIHRPKHIVELGACFGGWAVYMDKCLENKPSFLTLIEHFQGSEWNQKLSTKKNKALLEKILSKKGLSIPYEILTTNDVNLVKNNYDVFRYDGYSSYNTFKNYIDRANDDSLIIIHDFNFNHEVGPIFYSLKYSLENELYPVWFGQLSSVWTKNKDHKAFLLDNILKTYGLDNLKNSWTKTKLRLEYEWDVSDKNFLDFQNVLITG
jgi:hypothetical protein